MLSTIIIKLRQYPDYFKSLASGYGLMVANIVIQVVLVPLYVKVLGKYQFGVLMLLLAFVNYAAVGINWMTGGVMRVMGEFAANKNFPAFESAYSLSKYVYVGYALLLVGAVSVFWAFLGGVWEARIPPNAEHAVLGGIFFTALYLVAFYDLSVDRVALTAMGRQYAANLLQVTAVVSFAGAVVPLLLSGANLVHVMACMLGGVLLARVVSLMYWKRVHVRVGWRLLDKRQKDVFRRLRGKTGVAFFVYGAILLTMQADTMLVGYLGGVSMAAEYVLLWKVAEVAVFLIWRIPETLLPDLIHMDARNEQARLGRTYRSVWRWTFGAALLAGIGYAIFGHEIVSLWVGADHAPHRRWGYVLAGAGIFLLGSCRTPAVFAYGTLRLRQLIKVSSLELLLKLGLTVLLFPYLGYLSPLAALVATHASGVYYLYWKLGSRSYA